MNQRHSLFSRRRNRADGGEPGQDLSSTRNGNGAELFPESVIQCGSGMTGLRVTPPVSSPLQQHSAEFLCVSPWGQRIPQWIQLEG
jgi:hypothetical protein